MTPGVGATRARREWVRRLKSVDLPVLGRPTSATTGSASSTSARGSGASPDTAATATGARRADARRTGLARREAGHAQSPKSRRRAGCAGPVLLHPHEELEVDAGAEELLEVAARRLADRLQTRTALADDDRLLRVASDVDGGGDHDQVLLRLLLEHVDADGDRVRHLFARRQHHLLADDLGDDGALGLVGELVRRIVARPLRQRRLERAQQLVDVLAGHGAHRHDGPIRQQRPDGGEDREQRAPWRRASILFSATTTGLRPLGRRAATSRSAAVSPSPRRDHPECDVGFAQARHRALDHAFGEQVARRVDAGRVEEEQLRRRRAS